MMRFAIGLAIIAFTIIVGTYQFFEDVDSINARQQGLERSLKKQKKFMKIQKQSKNLASNAVAKGDDKKNKIERQLGIGKPNLSFSFVGQSNEQNKPLFRHTFKITGFSKFDHYLTTMRNLDKLPGFIVYNTCYGCIAKKVRTKRADDEHSVTIEGYLYVYDPRQL